MSYSEVAARPEEPLPPRTPEARQGRGLGVRRWNDFSSEPMELFLNISGKKKKYPRFGGVKTDFVPAQTSSITN